MVQCIIRYLKSTSTLGLTFKKSTFKIEGFADSDYAGDTQDRKSTSGWFFKIGDNTVSFKSTKQKSVALSTTEAEYMAASDATKEAIWLEDLLMELKLIVEPTATLHQDNQGAIFLERNHSNNPRSKHIDVRYHFIRDMVDTGRVTILYCPTDLMTADILTKPLPTEKFKLHRNNLMTIDLHNDKTDLMHHKTGELIRPTRLHSEGAC
jgi:hypothetical protein